MEKIVEKAGRITGLYTEELSVGGPFLDLAARFAHEPGTVCLMSGGELDCANVHLLAVRPWLTFQGRGREMTLTVGGERRTLDADPFDILRFLTERFAMDLPDIPGPVASGLFGYLSYDLKDHIEALPRTTMDEMALPQIWFSVPSALVVKDKRSGVVSLHVPEREGVDIEGILRGVRETAGACQWDDPGYAGGTDGFRSNFDKETYMDAIREIKEYISSGDIYQVNMSQRFEGGFTGSPFSLFRELYRQNPAPFFAFVNAGDHQIVSTSPERFIRQAGSLVESRPIKGTRPRGGTVADDERLRQELQSSTKDDAELSMIVDLMRNDIGKVCRGNTVSVTEHKRVEAYANVFHLISVVEGELEAGKDAVDLLRATFPGGSITGCPKIRSMEIIDELETSRRHIYTGSIGYISFHRTMDFSIAIRTATVCHGKLVFSVGGGVVYDSDPEDEYNETLHKGQTLFRAFAGGGRGAAPGGNAGEERYVWLNGALKPSGKALVDVEDTGFQYGNGFFETLRVERGETRLLSGHMARFAETWLRFFGTGLPDLSWEEIIRRVVVKNRLEAGVAAVKIIAASSETSQRGFNLVATARPYVHRLESLGKTGLSLVTYPECRRTPLAACKTMNYLYCFQAGKHAREQGGDEALILNADGTVSETNTANILLLKGREVIFPLSAHVLAGVMQQRVGELLTERGYETLRKPVLPEELKDADGVILTNALMGAVPVVECDGVKLSGTAFVAGEINRSLGIG